MKFCRVIVELVKMNYRRFVVRRDRHIPFASERNANVGFDSVQRFVRRCFVKSNRDTVLGRIQPYLLYIRVRFDQPDYSQPCAGFGVCTFRVCIGFMRHLSIIAKECALPWR